MGGYLIDRLLVTCPENTPMFLFFIDSDKVKGLTSRELMDFVLDS